MRQYEDWIDCVCICWTYASHVHLMVRHSATIARCCRGSRIEVHPLVSLKLGRRGEVGPGLPNPTAGSQGDTAGRHID